MKKIQNKQICSSVRRPAYTTWAFTLVELIVVITILAILGTIAFISLQGYSSQARDSKRLSDIQNIKKSLELFSLNTGKYPEPDEFFTVSYSGEIARYQGIVGEQVSTNLSRNLNEKPTDPLTGLEYTYSTTHSQTEYEVLGLYESDLIGKTSPQPSPTGEGARPKLFSSSNAASLDFSKIEGNYNGIYVKTPNFYVPTPSIINGNIWGNIDFFDDETLITSQVITGGSNIPGESTGGLDITLEVYEGTLTSNSTEEEKVNLVNAIKTAYSGSILASDTSYADILSRTSTGEMVDFVDVVVLEIAEYSTFASSGGGDSSGGGEVTCEDGYAWNGIACVSLAPFIKTFGGTGSDYIESLSFDTSGNIYVGGWYENNSSNSYIVDDFGGNSLYGKTALSSFNGFLAKLDSNGNQIWIKTFGGDSPRDIVSSILVDSNGNIYAGGWYKGDNVVDFSGNALTSNGDYDGFLAKLDNNGNQIWIKTFGGIDGDIIRKLSIDNNGNIYVGGSYENDVSNTSSAVDFLGNSIIGYSDNSDISCGFIAKLDNNGNQQWIKTFGGEGVVRIRGFSSDVNGNIYACGIINNDLSNTNNIVDFGGNILLGKSSTISDDGFLVKLDNNGNQIWVKTLGGSGTDFAYKLSTDNNGNIFVGGYYQNDLSDTKNVVNFLGNSLIGNGGTDGYITKLDSNGNQQWIMTIGGSNFEYIYSVSTDINGNVYVGGKYKADDVIDFGGSLLAGNRGDYDVFLAKLNNNGEQNWIKTFGGDYLDSINGTSMDINGNLYAIGRYNNNLSNSENVVEFSGLTLNGVTNTVSADAYLIRVNQ